MSTITIGAKGAGAVAANRALMGHNVFAHQTLFHSQNKEYTATSERASRDMKWWLGYPVKNINGNFGDEIRGYLNGTRRLTAAMHARRIRRKYEKPRYISPVKVPYKFQLIGFPGIGTHSWISPPNNWESDNACDVGCNEGTPIVAVADGHIGPSFGPLPDPDPRFHGIRLHLVVPQFFNEFYYAHLKSTAAGIKPGVQVKQGQLLGLSGTANGVEHLHIGEANGNPVHDLFGRDL